jgi:hypothetical protein
VLQWLFFDQYSHEPYAAIRAWCERVREQPGHIPITEG